MRVQPRSRRAVRIVSVSLPIEPDEPVAEPVEPVEPLVEPMFDEPLEPVFDDEVVPVPLVEALPLVPLSVVVVVVVLLEVPPVVPVEPVVPCTCPGCVPCGVVVGPLLVPLALPLVPVLLDCAQAMPAAATTAAKIALLLNVFIAELLLRFEMPLLSNRVATALADAPKSRRIGTATPVPEIAQSGNPYVMSRPPLLRRAVRAPCNGRLWHQLSRSTT